MNESILLFCLCLCTLGNAQIKYDYTWVLGSFDTEGIIVDFNGGEVEITSYQKPQEYEMASSNTTISDDTGNLLFYTNGCGVYNDSHLLMEDGYGLNPGSVFNEFCPGGYPTIQGSLSLPSLENDSIFYLLQVPRGQEDIFFSDRVYSNVVNVTANNGDGLVLEKNTVVFEDSLWAGYLTAVRHGDNERWWVIAGDYYPDKFHRLLLDSAGVELVGEQDFGIGFGQVGWGVGQAVFSPDGTKYAHYNRESQVQLYGFDRETGLFDEPEELFIADTIYFGGVAFSSSGRFFYVSNAITLYQFDLEAENVQASKTLVGEFDNMGPSLAANFSLMQLAPDCRIYMITGNGVSYLHVIDHPNRKGDECGFRQRAIELPSSNFRSIPNHPNYRLGTPYPVCDSTIQLVSSTVRVLPPTEQVRLWPNPASGAVNVELSRPLAAVAEWRLFNGTGALVRESVLPAGQVQYAADVSGLPGGLYFWGLRSEGARIGGGKVVVK